MNITKINDVTEIFHSFQDAHFVCRRTQLLFSMKERFTSDCRSITTSFYTNINLLDPSSFPCNSQAASVASFRNNSRQIFQYTQFFNTLLLGSPLKRAVLIRTINILQGLLCKQKHFLNKTTIDQTTHGLATHPLK